MKVISNSSILIGLSAIGRLELLHRRFPEGVIVPDAVWQEVVETGHGRTGAEQVATAEWICRQQIQNKVFPLRLFNNLTIHPFNDLTNQRFNDLTI